MKKRASIITFIVGAIALIAAIVFCIFSLTKKPNITDANFLIDAGNWTEEGTENVVWNFTEIGKGTLTTNNHINDYDFIWSIEGNILKIETSWLYDLENEYTYELDQENSTLVLTSSDDKIIFKAKEDKNKIDQESGESNNRDKTSDSE